MVLQDPGRGDNPDKVRRLVAGQGEADVGAVPPQRGHQVGVNGDQVGVCREHDHRSAQIAHGVIQASEIEGAVGQAQKQDVHLLRPKNADDFIRLLVVHLQGGYPEVFSRR